MKLPSYERMRTVSFLLFFLRTAMNIGRVPSVLGGEFFRLSTRSKPSYALENSVVFVCDVERCLAALAPLERRIVSFCIFENYSEWDAARRFQRAQSEISRRLGDALDCLHEMFIRKKLLPPLAQLPGQEAAEIPEQIQPSRREKQ